jgi:ABC-type bacteriocin/lantibiotic exporter with double-glycine peptidase domain
VGTIDGDVWWDERMNNIILIITIIIHIITIIIIILFLLLLVITTITTIGADVIIITIIISIITIIILACEQLWTDWVHRPAAAQRLHAEYMHADEDKRHGEQPTRQLTDGWMDRWMDI